MNGPSLLIQSDPPITLLSVGESAPGLSYPLISSLGAIHRPADGSETGNVSIDLDNADGVITQLFAVPPLRAAAVLYGPQAEVWFSGSVEAISIADKVTLTVVS